MIARIVLAAIVAVLFCAQAVGQQPMAIGPTGAWLPLSGGTLIGPSGAAVTLTWPNATNGGNFSQNELMFMNDLAAQNVLTMYNASSTGFTAITARGDDKVEHLALGFANTGTSYFGGNISFLEISSFPNAGTVTSSQLPPVEFRIPRTGWIADSTTGALSYHSTSSLVIQNRLTGVEGRWQWPTLNTQFTTFAAQIDPGAPTVLANCSMSGGSPTLTCTDATFVATDVGKNVKVSTCNSGGVLSSTIIARSSGTVVTLAANSAGGCSGSAASYGVSFLAANDRLLVGNGNTTTTPVATFDNYGHAVFGAATTNRASDCSNFVLCTNEATNRLGRFINSGNYKFDMLLQTGGNRVDFQDTDHSNAIPLSMAFDGTGNVSLGNHVLTKGSAPALTSCGTSPAISGSDLAGEVTMGTASPTGCVITFATAYTSAPYCTVTWQATPLASQSYTVSNAAITLVQTATSSNKVNYHCTARSGG